MTAEQIRERNNQAQRERRIANPRENADTVQRWRERHPETARERSRQKGAQYRDKYLYGLTPEGRARLLAEQDGCCYLCGEPLQTGAPGMVHVDHDHACCRGVRSCGTCVRGLACEPCNKGIGAFGDDPERMRRVADNLEMANRSLRETCPIRANQASSNALAGEES
jgi:hypothetical protein